MLDTQTTSDSTWSGVFGRVPNAWFSDRRLDGLRPTSIKVLMYLVRLACHGDVCWPSQGHMQSHLKMSRRSVQLALKQLVEARLNVGLQPGRRGRATLYRVPDLTSLAGSRAQSASR